MFSPESIALGKTNKYVQSYNEKQVFLQLPIVELLSKVDSGRCVGIEIFNKTKSITLHSPRTYCDSGFVHSPPSPTISPGTVDSSIYVKVPSTASGTVGVLTYHFSESYTMAIVFSNPYDYSLYSVVFGILITDKIDKVDSDLYKDLYYTKVPSSSFKRVEVGKSTETLEVSHGPIKVAATMSNDYKAILKVEIYG